MKTHTSAALAASVAFFMVGAGVLSAQDPEPPHARLRVPVTGTVTGKSKAREKENEKENEKGTFAGTLSIERFAARDNNTRLVAIGMVAGTAIDKSGNPIGSLVVGQVELPVDVSSGGSTTATAGNAAAAPAPQAVTCGVLHLDVGAANLSLLGLKVATAPVSIDLSASSDGTGVLGHLICTALDTVNNVVGLVDVVNKVLGLVGGLLGGLTGGLTGGSVP
jgi:hypothetical protein